MERGPISILIVTVLLVGGMAMALEGGEGDEGRGPTSVGDRPVWTDPLDDLSHVYAPGGDLVGVEVTGGEARLRTGFDEGWFASTIITCPPGYRYNLVFIEADTPGNSYVEVSVLNASKESSVVGFANETIAGFVRLTSTDVSVNSISPALYPELRIQVNLMASGSDRPTVQAWTLYYCLLDEWRDELVGSSKLTSFNGINLTDGRAEINLSRGGGGPSSEGYNPFPPIFSPAGGGTDDSPVFFANTARDGYNDATQFNYRGRRSMVFGDLNDDGYLDMVCGNDGYAGSAIDSQIFWGTSTEERWTDTGAAELNMGRCHWVDLGDVNGDGEVDIVMAVHSSEEAGSAVFLGQGEGSFNYQPSIVFDGVFYHWVATGDVNGDGYDDILYGNHQSDAYYLYYGGPSGPDATVDETYTVADPSYNPIVEDLDGDGFMDLALPSRMSGKVPIYLGGQSGPGTTPDIELPFDVTIGGVGAGDINGDGLLDIVITGQGKIRIYEGTGAGWSVSVFHDITTSGLVIHPKVFDINQDGYDDILVGASNNNFNLYLGGTSWPTSHHLQKSGVDDSWYVYPAIPKGRLLSGHRGTIVTEAIRLPQGKKWDILNIEGTQPPNSTVEITVLNGAKRPIPGYDKLTDWSIDLSGISDWTIHVKISMWSELNNTTPTIDHVLVNWIDEMSWREQFYGLAKVEKYMGLGVSEHILQAPTATMTGPQLLFASLRGDSGLATKSQLYVDPGDLGYLDRAPMAIGTRGASAVDTADIDGDGDLDVAFAVHRTSDTTYGAKSPLFLSSPFGLHDSPAHSFDTTGALDVLLRDLNGDGHVDVVFAQEQDNGDYFINSTLFWGSSTGWNSTPDVNFSTTGASGLEAADADGDGDLDLVFACFRGTSYITDSMVFLQSPSGFDGASPSYKLTTWGTRAVAAGDVNGDTRMDLVFANHFASGQSEIDSFIYWGKAGGGFDTASPTHLPTMGASDVKLADLDGDGDLDVVFANYQDNNGIRYVDSYVYLNGGSGTFGSGPDISLPTVGAVAVDVGDLDGIGWLDIVLACQYNGTGYAVPSAVYLGGTSGWSSTPDIELPTEGASDVMIAQLSKVGHGGYMSKAITPENPTQMGTFHTLSYEAVLGGGQTGSIQLVDAVTMELLKETPILPGANEWPLEGTIHIKDHPSVRVVVTAEGLDQPGSFEIDNLLLNWTKRVKLPPVVMGITLSEPAAYRLSTVSLQVNVTDEYDPPSELMVTVQHSLNGTDTWSWHMIGTKAFKDGVWTMGVTPRIDVAKGCYDLRVLVRDTDRLETEWVLFPNALEVLNNIPTAPEISLVPATPDTAATLRVEITRSAQDVEGTGLTYWYVWYKDGELQPPLVTDSVDPALTQKGQNWSVEVRASDGEDESPAATAWAIIRNAMPRTALDLPDPSFEEDTTDSEWLDLSTAFEDPDDDALTWSVGTPPMHIIVEIDPVTGRVTLTPEENWSGEENITFVASDGEDSVSQTVTVYVTAVNDVPRIATVNGAPIGDGPVEMTIKQGALLSIDVLVQDEEGDELVYDLNTTLFTIDETTGSIRWQPDNDAVGTLRFRLTVWDTVTPSARVTLDFVIEVENENDPMDEPRITAPADEARYDEGVVFSLIASCTDPDTRYGQVLNFSWSSNMSGPLGYGPSLGIALNDVGTHVITLTVTDGEFQRAASVKVVIKAKADVTPPPPPDGDGDGDEGINYALVAGIVAALVVIGVLFFVVRTRKHAEELETADEEEYKREHMERAYEAVKAAADRMEAEREEASKAEEDVEIKTEAAPSIGLSIEARETEAASAQTLALFGAAAAEPVMSEEEQEQLRLDNLKRKYQNAIGRLPYGIPSPELKERDWVELANALATGEKKETPGGRELTKIDGTWYYSEVKDTGTFLKGYGAKDKPKVEEKKKEAVVTTDKATLLAKLEERFILGEISEEAYSKLVEKYSEEE